MDYFQGQGRLGLGRFGLGRFGKTMFLEARYHQNQFITVAEHSSQETIAAVFC